MTVTFNKKPTANLEPENAMHIDSISAFLDALATIKRGREHVLFFRGHSNFSYELKPSIYRNSGWIENEDILFKELILRCPNDFFNQSSTFQTLVKMQHYSLPTRLLDLTANPLIALYFACSTGKLLDESGEVITFRIPKIEVKYYDSDTVSVISNISRRPSNFAPPTKYTDIETFNADDQIKLLLHEIKSEKPYFEPIIKPAHLETVVFVKPKLDNERIIRQDGAFLLFGINGNKLSPAKVPSHFHSPNDSIRILIKAKAKKSIINKLESLGITQGTIYPEIEQVAKHIKKLYEEPTEN